MGCANCKKNLLQNAIAIIQGNVNLFCPTDETEALKASRMPICNGCEYRNVLINWMGKTHYYCGRCNCPLDSKLTVKSEVCPHPDGPKW